MLWRLIATKRYDDDTAYAKAACFMIAQAMVDLRNLRTVVQLLQKILQRPTL